MSRKPFLRLIPVLALALLSGGAPLRAAAAPADLAARIDPIFKDFRSDGPGCAVRVMRDGALVFAKGYGLANLEHGAPITPKTVFYVGSVSKQFTAMTVAHLARQGKLSLDDEVRKHVPGRWSVADQPLATGPAAARSAARRLPGKLAAVSGSRPLNWGQRHHCAWSVTTNRYMHRRVAFTPARV